MNPKSGKAGKVVSPTSPSAAHDADVADPGEVSEIKAEQRKTKSGKYGSVKVKPFKPPDPVEAEQENKTWIEIEMIDENDDPVPGERYEITMPDGQSVSSGTLDTDGKAKVTGIDPGTCKVRFPNLDKEAWEKIS
jgi:type VI secretion system secreted protein VgrG